MYGIRPEEQQILDLLLMYGPLPENQLIRYFDRIDTGMLLHYLERKRLVRRKNEYVIPEITHTEVNQEAIKAFEVILLFKDRISFHCPADPPFAISYMKDQKSYDIAVITKISPENKCHEVDVSQSKRVVFVTDTIEQASKITTIKEAGICILHPEVKLFELGGI